MMICTIGPNLLDLPRNYSHSIRSGSDMIIGLTGGIASGKSTAAKFLASKGAQVMDGDFLGHRAYEPNTTAFSKIVETFGNDIVGGDGQIDRKVLGGKVFGNSDALKQLTDILWPEIRRMFSEWISNGKDNNPNALMVMDAAVLLEAGWEGVLVLEFSNHTSNSIRLYANSGAAQILFFQGEEPEVSYADRKGKYQGQTGITLAKSK